jgi:hypothetical protein
MNVQVAVLCDAATSESEKLNLLGAFDTIYAPQMPAIHPHCAVALRITFSPEDEGTHQLKLSFVNEDGQPVLPNLDTLDMPIEVRLPEDSHFLSRNFVLSLQNLKFDEPGFHSVELSVDNKSLASIPLLVKLIPAAPTQPQTEA